MHETQPTDTTGTTQGPDTGQDQRTCYHPALRKLGEALIEYSHVPGDTSDVIERRLFSKLLRSAWASSDARVREVYCRLLGVQEVPYKPRHDTVGSFVHTAGYTPAETE